MKRSMFFCLMLVFLHVNTPYCTEIPSGYVSGQWQSSGNPYNINGDITVPADSMLIIHQGVMVVFQGHYTFTVHGLLNADGNENDSIVFTTADTSFRWGGLRFVDAASTSVLSFCIIEHGRASGTTPNTFGGGVYCFNSSVTIGNCRISDNHADYSGGGIALIESANSFVWTC
jgi:hypothetical protein